jgi:NADH-quinone oxidoreductase subunit N
MSVPELAWHDVLPLVPALILSAGAIFLLITEVFLSTSSRAYQAAVALVSAVAAGVVAVRLAAMSPRAVFLGFAVLDGFSSLITAIVCLGLSLSVLLSLGFLRHRNAERGEFYALMLFASAGMSLLALSSELITIFISLEMMSISTYALVCYLRRGKRPSEAGFKYFILGAFSSALLLYGFALIYGATGSTHLYAISRAIPGAMAAQPALVYCGAILIAAGFGFKVAAVPLHMWTPDVYEGAPTPVTALMSVGVKASAFAVLIRVFSSLGSGSDLRLASVVFSALALLTMVVGNLVALPQRNVKRMLAYSSIAHAGYHLLGVAALFAHPGAAQVGWQFLNATPLTSAASAAELARAGTLRGILFYLLAYTVTAAGAFGTLSALERREDEEKPTAWDIDRFSGLAQRRPGWAIAMAVFMLSLGGIPPTVGFIGKLLIFQSAVGAGLVGLVVIGILSSVAGAYYYLRVVVYMFMRPAEEGAPLPSRQWATEVALVLSTLAVLALGILPGIAIRWFSSAAALWAGP